MQQQMRSIRKQPVFGPLKLRSSALAIACCLPLCLPAEAAPAPTIFVNGAQMPVSAVERNKRVFVPMRGVFEKLGATVDYSPPRTVAAKKNGASLAQLTLGSRTALVQGSARRLEAPPFKSASRIFVPLRLISEAAGAKVAYVAAPRSVRIIGTAPAAAAQPATQRHGIPWWMWLLSVLLVLFLLLRLVRRQAHDAVVTTRSSGNPTIGTSART